MPDIHPSSELRNRANENSHCHSRTREPVCSTRDGYGDMDEQAARFARKQQRETTADSLISENLEAFQVLAT